jgi:hypothetical protein
MAHQVVTCREVCSNCPSDRHPAQQAIGSRRSVRLRSARVSISCRAGCLRVLKDSTAPQLRPESWYHQPGHTIEEHSARLALGLPTLHHHNRSAELPFRRRRRPWPPASAARQPPARCASAHASWGPRIQPGSGCTQTRSSGECHVVMTHAVIRRSPDMALRRHRLTC